MYRRMLLSASFTLLAAAPLSAQSVANRFVPSVEFADTTATCSTLPPNMLQVGERGFLLRFGPSDVNRRVVTAVWDSAGQLRRYSDARGDLRGPGTPKAERGKRTTITIDVAKNGALLWNEEHGQSETATMTTSADALDATRLGPPRRLLARLHEQCGAPE